MKQLKDLAVKAYNMTDEEVQSLFDKTDEGEQLREDAVETLLKRDAESKKQIAKRIREELKPEMTSKFDEGYSKAKKESLEKFEKDLREKYGVESDKKGIDLIDDLVSMNKQSEDIKTHPDYIKLERKLQGEFIPKQDYEKVSTEFNEYKQAVARDKTISRVIEDARKIFRATNPILSSDPKRAANQESEFLKQFKGFDYELQDDGQHVIIKDGKRLENENMNAVSFPEYVKARTQDLFDIKQQGEKGGAGFTAPEGTSANFKTKEEFMSAYYKETDPDKRVKMMDTAKAKGIV